MNLPLVKKYLFLMVVLLIQSIAFGQLPPSDPAYQLVFVDEFNGTSLDYTKWDRIPPWNQSSNVAKLCNSNVNTDVAYRKWKTNIPGQFDTTNCKINNGTVKLHTKKENYVGGAWVWPNGVFDTLMLPYKYTTSMLYSKSAFRFGYFEIRFKLPNPPNPPKRHLGFGPNFWLFAADPAGQNGWVNHWSEIDVFEINSFDLAQNTSSLYTNNAHYRNCPGAPCHITNYQHVGSITNNVWHTAAANWTPTKIEFYLDGVKLRDFPCEQLDFPADSLVAMNLWIDVNAPALNFCTPFDTLSANSSAFPYIYEIDYVKIWQLKKECDVAQQYCNFIPANYQSKLYESVSIGGSSCVSSISNQSNFSIHPPIIYY